MIALSHGFALANFFLFITSYFPEMWTFRGIGALLPSFMAAVAAAPSGFPASGNGLWFRTPGLVWSRDFLPIGNGFLAAMTPGGTTQEITQLNIESLWSGGPFDDPTYNGGNHQPSERATLAEDMQSIRQTIFSSPIGEIDNIEVLATDAGAYGSYAGAGYLITTVGFGSMDGNSTVSNYARWLDLDEGIARTAWSQNGFQFSRETFCSAPTQACVQQTSMSSEVKTKKSPLTLTYAFSPSVEESQGLPVPNVTCLASSPNTLMVRGTASTAPGAMVYEILGRVESVGGSVSCNNVGTTNATITVQDASSAWITWVGGTDWSQDGPAGEDFTFKGIDPHDELVQLIKGATNASGGYNGALASHIADYKATLTDNFELSLGQTPNMLQSTDEIKSAYNVDTGDAYLEWVLFNYGRYLFASSSCGVLPANLQGKWADGYGNAWSADYHSNINIQMNYWSAEMSNLDVSIPLFDYIEKNWASRGAETAKVLYNITRGWVTHDEMNIFGHTGMKASGNSAQWANYPESAVWMMIHAWDHFDYTNNVTWWKTQGWPLIKEGGVASFHLDKLIPDLYFNDSTLVVNPCNSPEQVPITFGCAHSQQLIWQLFNAVEKGFAASGDTDIAFLEEVRAKRAQMDKGLRIGSWGQLQEWKVEKDSPTDTHRHLSHLIGLYPGYAITSYDPTIQGGLIVNGTAKNYTRSEVIAAAETSLIHRGNGTGPDADSGWEKAWRAAAWAQLGNAAEYYHELTYAIYENFGANLFSLYDPSDADPIFQIDANLGYPAAVLNGLLQAPDVASLSTPLTITILPALPANWATGFLRGARVRGGITVTLQWHKGKATSLVLEVDADAKSRSVQVVHEGKVISSFTSSPSLNKSIVF